MLVLSRKKGESIVIGDDIEITVLESDGDTVKIGIAAPKKVNIYRKEVYLAIQQVNVESSKDVLKPADLGKLFNKKSDESK